MRFFTIDIRKSIRARQAASNQPYARISSHSSKFPILSVRHSSYPAKVSARLQCKSIGTLPLLIITMRPNCSLQLHSTLLARASTLLTQSHAGASPAAAALSCTFIHRAYHAPTSSNVRCLNYSAYQNETLSRQPNFLIRSSSSSRKPLTQRYNSTISSNPPPPSTSDRARKSQQTYTPPESTSTSSSSSPSSRSSSAAEAVPIPDPTLSYAAPMTSTTTSSSSATSSIPLTWNAFLALRKTRRRYNLLASVCTSLVTTSTGISILAQQNIETAGIFGFDPFLVLGIATAGSAAVGWLMGPFVGNAVFAGVHRSRREDMAMVSTRSLFSRCSVPLRFHYSNPCDMCSERARSLPPNQTPPRRPEQFLSREPRTRLLR